MKVVPNIPVGRGSDAYVILQKHMAQRRDSVRAVRLKCYIVCGDRYFFPVHVPLLGKISERGFYVTPTTGHVEYIDRPWNDVRRVMTGWEDREMNASSQPNSSRVRGQ